jgi:hypothetical protein
MALFVFGSLLETKTILNAGMPTTYVSPLANFIFFNSSFAFLP